MTADDGRVSVELLAPGAIAQDERASDARHVWRCTGGLVVARTEKELVWYDLATGEERFTDRVDSDEYWDVEGQGKANVYLLSGTELRAYSPAEEDQVWSYDLEEDSSWVSRVGSRLFLTSERGLSLLG